MATKPTPETSKTGAAPAPRSWLRDDFPVIRNATILFALALLFGFALVGITQYLLSEQQTRLDQAQAEERNVREKLQRVSVEKNEIHDFQPKYLQLVAQGFVGDEKRLDWIDTIQAIQKKARLEPVIYDIAEQTTFPADPLIDTGTLELHASKMHFKMALLHEVDLLRLLDGLQVGQVNDMQSCTISRGTDPAPDDLSPRLRAECNLYWITLGNHAEAATPALQGP